MWEGRQRQQSVRYRSCVEQHRSHPVGAVLGGVRTQLSPSRPPLLRPMDTGICKNVRKRVRSFEKVRNIAGQRRASGSGGVLVRRGFCSFWSRLRRRARYFTHTHTRSGFFCGDIMRKPVRVAGRPQAGKVHRGSPPADARRMFLRLCRLFLLRDSRQ